MDVDQESEEEYKEVILWQDIQVQDVDCVEEQV